MVTGRITRRAAALGLVALAGLPGLLRADEVLDIKWADLLPPGEAAPPAALQGVIRHDDAPLASQQPASSGVRTDWNGRTVRLSGFILPLDYAGTGLTVFMLVPYVGACIHVPPPPANQLIMVTTKRPYEPGGLFEAVTVTGVLGTVSTETALAMVGYTLTDSRAVRFRG